MKTEITAKYGFIFNLFDDVVKERIMKCTHIYDLGTHYSITGRFNDFAIVMSNRVLYRDNVYEFKNRKMAIIKAICLVNKDLIVK